MPPLFCIYLVAAPVLALALGAVVFAPLAPYLLAVIGQTGVTIFSKGVIRSLLASPLLVASHVFYGLGFWRGLFTKLKLPGDKPAAEVKLETIAL